VSVGYDKLLFHERYNFAVVYLQIPIPGGAQSKARVCGCPLGGIEGSNPAGGTDVCLL
jgi:hypothetical protein